MATILVGGWSEGIGFSHVISTGNEADLDIVDAGRFLLADPDTHCIALTIEAVRDGTGFRRLLADAQRAAKPVVLLKTGRSQLGQQMAASHTGALAGSHEVFLAVARHHGAVVVDDVDALWQVAQMFARLRASQRLLPVGGRFAGEGCAACSISGGHIGLLADLAADAGMRFPGLSASTQERLAQGLGKDPPIVNPVDMSGGSVSDHSTWARTLQPLLDDPAVTVALPVLTVAKNYDTVSADLERLALSQVKPILVTWAGDSFQGERKAALQRSPLPLFATPGRTARALVALDAWQRAHAAAARSETTPAQAPHPLVAAAAQAGRAALTERESKQVLAGLGFPTTRERLARTVDEAVAAAREIGFPVVLKGEHPAIGHKTEAGLVRLGVADEQQVRAAFGELLDRMARAAPSAAAHGVLVAEQVPPGVELMMGVRRDPVFGPMLMFGLGGIHVEALQDTQLAPPPDLARARAMVEGIRAVSLLRGARGRAPADIERLAILLVRLGEFAVANADHVAELDLNPLVLLDRPVDQLRVLDALVVLAPPSAGVR
jgi:acetate---CoA ligase (ADP-forming)